MDTKNKNEKNIIINDEIREATLQQIKAILGDGTAIREMIYRICLFAVQEIHILFMGETGTGKEEVVRFTYELSSRYGKPFIPVDCAALVGTLAEAELFGCKKGAYTEKIIKK